MPLSSVRYSAAAGSRLRLELPLLHYRNNLAPVPSFIRSGTPDTCGAGHFAELQLFKHAERISELAGVHSNRTFVAVQSKRAREQAQVSTCLGSW